jgi:hypothetical protein
MKTPKQTATELVEKYKKHSYANTRQDDETFAKTLHKNAKECALIDIQGKIELLAEINNNEAFNVSHYANELQIIKKEIENL